MDKKEILKGIKDDHLPHVNEHKSAESNGLGGCSVCFLLDYVDDLESQLETMKLNEINNE